jgi:hypothetical protein
MDLTPFNMDLTILINVTGAFASSGSNLTHLKPFTALVPFASQYQLLQFLS